MSTSIPSFKISSGNILHEKYRILQKIGQGGMSIIYEAVDIDSSKVVAIKQIIQRFSIENKTDQKESIERLQREYQILHTLRHSNLIQVFDIFEENEQFFLVMEILKGISLQDFLRQHINPIELTEQLAIAYHIANATYALNNSGIIHRDIKPANVMLIPQENRVVLLDLGLAKNLRQSNYDITATGSIVGTPEYLSPEQINGEISDQSDIFSLGVTLYQLFSWSISSPFKSKIPMNTMTKVLVYDPPSLASHISRKNRHIAQKLSALLTKSMAKQPENRWPNAQMIAKELEKLYENYYNNRIQHHILRLEVAAEKSKVPESDTGFFWYQKITWLYKVQNFVKNTLRHYRYKFCKFPVEVQYAVISFFMVFMVLMLVLLLQKIIQ